jgi:3'-5' exonuclease
MYKLYLDIETLPAGEESHEALKMLHAKKKAKKKKEGCEEQDGFEQYLLGTSFDGSFGRILCIGYAIDDNPAECLCDDKDEAKILREFWEIAEDANLFIGHNIIDFDMRFIYQRSIINNVLPPLDLTFARYRNSPMYDTMKEWVKWSMGSVGLEHLALALGIPTPKDGIDGSQVNDFYNKGKIDEICEYCKRDVEATRAVYKRMTFQ